MAESKPLVVQKIKDFSDFLDAFGNLSLVVALLIIGFVLVPLMIFTLGDVMFNIPWITYITSLFGGLFFIVVFICLIILILMVIKWIKSK